MSKKMLPFFSFRSGLDDIFNDFRYYPTALHAEAAMYPKINISETNKEFEISADLPGIEKKDIKVSVENGVLTILGEKKYEKKEEHKNWHRVESSYGAFERRIQLSDNAKEDSIKADFKDGVLHITIQKKQPSEITNKPKLIEIK